MKVAIVGSTGLVGTEMLKVLEGSSLNIKEIIPISSQKSVGKTVTYRGKSYSVVGMEQGLGMRPDVALFSAGGSVSLEWAPKFAEQGIFVVDNSSAWRMDPTKKLIIPEINGDMLTPTDKLIANPNCSTIQLLMVLGPLYKKYGVKRVVVSTYQAVTGTGYKAVNQLMAERKGETTERAYPHRIDLNCIPQCDVFTENGYTKEEMKMVNETRKILNDNSIPVTATAVRVPVIGGHSESVNVELASSFTLDAVRELLGSTPGVVVVDNPEKNEYPMPINAHGRNEVFVGRIREDFSIKNGLNLWIVADNLRKGAATNTVQIAEFLSRKGWIG